MNRKRITSRHVNKRLSRKAYRQAEQRAIDGIRPRTLKTISYNVPSGLRHSSLPLIDASDYNHCDD